MSIQESSIDIHLSRVDRIYRPNDKVEGKIVIYAKRSWTHSGVNMVADGILYLSHSPNADGKPTVLMKIESQALPPGKITEGITEIPFAFFLNPIAGEKLYETYHGLYVSVIYGIKLHCDRGVLKKALQKETEYTVEIPKPTQIDNSKPIEFHISPESLVGVSQAMLSSLPKFSVSGKLHRSICLITQPLTGEVVIELFSVPIKAIDLQLVRVETVITDGRTTKEGSEIQKVQMGVGNVCRNLTIPLYMIFPRIFSCPTLICQNFKIEFELNLLISYGDGYQLTETMPITIYRDD